MYVATLVGTKARAPPAGAEVVDLVDSDDEVAAPPRPAPQGEPASKKPRAQLRFTNPSGCIYSWTERKPNLIRIRFTIYSRHLSKGLNTYIFLKSHNF